MADRVIETMIRVSERGHPRGATVVLERARHQVRPTPVSGSQRPPRRRVHPALAFATVVVVVVGGLVALLAGRGSTTVDTPEPTVPTTTPLTTARPGGADDVADLALGPDGRLWAATSVGVVVWDLETEAPTVFSEVDGLGGRRVDHVVVAADGTAWALGDSWLAHFDGAWTLLDDAVVDAAVLTPVGDIAVGPDGALWVAAGGPDALFRVDTDGATTYAIPDLTRIETPWTWSIAVDESGTVWASTGESGLFAFDGQWRHVAVDGVPNDLVGNVAVGPDGSVWVGGLGRYGEYGADVPAVGISRYDGTTWTTFTTADGLLADTGEVAVGPGGAIWAIHGDLGLAENGMSRFDGTAWTAYPGDDGGRGGGVVTADGTLWTASAGGIEGFDGTTIRRLVAGAEVVPPPAPPGAPVEFGPIAGLDPVRLTTSIGELEFTTWVHPDGDEPPGPMAATAHGVIGGMGPDGAMAWSVDGITWTEIPFATDGWSDRSATDSDDLVVWSVDDGVVRARWDGSAWVDAEFHHDPRLDGATDTLVGPRGIVVIRDEIYHWDGTGFAATAQPPDLSLHPGSSTGCAARDGLGWSAIPQLGPMVATDDGFVALTARFEDDWHRFPVCEPIVWFSTDGDEWVTLTDESPFGEGAVVRDLEVVGGAIVAAGEMPGSSAVWVSDDGATWDRADLDGDGILEVAGSDRGWIAAGRGNTIWFSPDGRVWDGPYERPPGWGDVWNVVGAAMLGDRIIGVGELSGVATEQSAASGVVVGLFVDG
jgi:hypothetical protein